MTVTGTFSTPPRLTGAKVSPLDEPSLVSKTVGARLDAIEKEEETTGAEPLPQTELAVIKAKRQELATTDATPVDVPTASDAGSSLANDSKPPSGANWDTALAYRVPSENVTATDAAVVAPTGPDRVDDG